MAKYSPIDILRTLKSDYSKGIMSALIGAGFSKNVSPLFPDWDQLLGDLVRAIYAMEIQIHWDNHCHQNPNDTGNVKVERVVKDSFIKNVFKSEGYLRVVSKYIADIGYREAIDRYIEERTPYIKAGNLMIGNNVMGPVSESDFGAHNALLGCDRFLNLYTTNYDNVLDYASSNYSTDRSVKIITSATELSNELNKRNIIKIHGDLKFEDSSDYEFDGDKHLRYIIAQEDYDTYIDKHEAFSHLMRIAMLQGKFCLVGFSGNDPNYMGWVKWMSDILYKKEVRFAESGKDQQNVKIEDIISEHTKIYLLSINADNNTTGRELYLKNHYITELNICDTEVLVELGFSNDDIKVILDIDDQALTYKDVFTAFFNYLHGGKADARFTSEEPDSGSSLLQDDSLSEYAEAKSKQYDYRLLWGKVTSLAYKHQDLSLAASQIRSEVKNIRFCRYVRNQERFIDSIVDYNGDLTEDEAFLFAQAIKEYGQIPNYYKPRLADKLNLLRNSIWLHLLDRQDTLHAQMDDLSPESDENIHENVVRSLFHLNFVKAERLLNEWNPTGYWKAVKLMRLDAFRHDDYCKSELISLAESTNDIQEKLYISVIANYISGAWPRPLDLEAFSRFGLDSQADIINYIADQLKDKIEKPKTRGWIGTTTYFDRHDSSYEAGLRLLQLLVDSGLYASYRMSNFLDIARWYKAFSSIYRYFPLPCFYYSIQYNDKDVLQRIGQDYAYCPGLTDFVDSVLPAAVAAIGEKTTPTSLIHGLLYTTGPMYYVVDESKWYEAFVNSILKPVLDEFSSYSYHDSIVNNMQFALVALRNQTHVQEVVSLILEHYTENTQLAELFIRNNVYLQYLNGELPEDCRRSIQLLIDSYPHTDVTGLLYYLNAEGVLGTEELDAFISKVKDVGISAIPTNLTSLFYLCLLCKADVDACNMAKEAMLQCDVWNCGVMEGGKSWTHPQYLRLHLLSNEVMWTDDEFIKLTSNLRKNIELYRSLKVSLHSDTFMKNTQILYLSDILKFIDSQRGERRDSLEAEYNLVSTMLGERINYCSLIQSMLSDQSADIDYAIDNVAEGIGAKGIDKYKDEVNFIVDRSIIGNGLAMSKNLLFIRHLVEEYSSNEIVLGLQAKFKLLLTVYYEHWQDYQDLRVPEAFAALHAIAVFLNKRSAEVDETIKYWIEDRFVLRFVR